MELTAVERTRARAHCFEVGDSAVACEGTLRGPFMVRLFFDSIIQVPLQALVKRFVVLNQRVSEWKTRPQTDDASPHNHGDEVVCALDDGCFMVMISIDRAHNQEGQKADLEKEGQKECNELPNNRILLIGEA